MSPRMKHRTIKLVRELTVLCLVSFLCLKGCQEFIEPHIKILNSGGISQSDRNKRVDCINILNGETFSFLGKDVNNIYVRAGSSFNSFDVVDNRGIHRKINTTMQQYIKCSKQDNEGSIAT